MPPALPPPNTAAKPAATTQAIENPLKILERRVVGGGGDVFWAILICNSRILAIISHTFKINMALEMGRQ